MLLSYFMHTWNMNNSLKKLAEKGIIQDVSDTTMYYDYLCKSWLKESDYKNHIFKSKHQFALSAFKKEFKIHGATVTCRVCEFEGDWPAAISHKRECHGSPIKHPSHDMYARFLMNTIIKKKQQYYCHVCSYELSNCLTTLNHIETLNHQDEKAKHDLSNPSLKKDLLKECDYKRIVYGCIYIGDNGFFICYTCKSYLLDIPSCLQHLDSCSNGDIKNLNLNCKVDDSTSDDNGSNKTYNTNGNSNMLSHLVSQCTQQTDLRITRSQIRQGNVVKLVPECMQSDVSAITLVKKLIPLLPQKREKKVKTGKIPEIDDHFNQKFLKYHADDIDTMDGIGNAEIKLSTQRSVRKKSSYIHCLLCNKKIMDDIHSYYQHLHTNYHISILTSTEAINDKCNRCKENKKRGKTIGEMKRDINLIEEFIVLHNTKQVNCVICNCIFLNETDVIRKHTLNKQHKENHDYARKVSEQLFENVVSFSLNWYNTYKYYSCLNNQKFKSDIDFKAVLNEYASKPKDLSKVCNLHDEKNQFMSCIYCATVWYGPPVTRFEHSSNKMHLYMMKSRDFLKLELASGVNYFLKNFEQKASDMVLNADLVQSKEEDKVQLIKCLEDTVKNTYPNVKAHAFGSRISGTGFLDSDIDIFLDCEGNTYKGDNTTYCQKLYFTNVEQCIRNKPEYWEVIELLPNSRTPIIKLYHRDTEIKCDISFSNGLSVENTKLLRCFNNKSPLCRKMILFLKKWLSLCGLSGPWNISSYSLAWCVIFYLQKEHKVFPSIASLIEKKNQSHIVAGWETGVSYDFTINSTSVTFKDILIGFFDYYAKFNYMDNVICPLLADVVLKRSFADWKCLSDKMRIYRAQLESEVKAKYFRIDSPLCLQDPFDLSYNITMAVQKLTLNRFRKYCEQSANVLRNI
ncbi:uncharacterized protein LOC107270837 [Cephus cinctus]|uniref:Uncharacterized protein LOC107270837 n=1 Tax=Cephus cinctus TaxID=211228 RepID=A0AAJ7FPC0_CEPCN|nr:uncharacterized protein LOC107270837 [Cephus cinctus]